MPKFVSRIELLNADKKDYQLLQEEMKKESFDLVRRNSSTSTKRLLTPVEYTLEGNISLSDATDATWRADRRTGKKYLFTKKKKKMGYEFDRASR